MASEPLGGSVKTDCEAHQTAPETVDLDGMGPEKCTLALCNARSKCRDTVKAQPQTRAFSFWTLE